MKYVLGIDSGGTKFLVRAASTDGTPLGCFEGGNCSHYGNGEAKAKKLIDEKITACLEQFGGKRSDCAAIVCGAAGYDSEEDGIIIHRMYETLPGFDCIVHCVNDSELAHHMITGGVGVLLISGTGSIVFGRNKAGKEIRVGGWNKEIASDEGSGRYIDAWALHHLSRYMDGVREMSPFLSDLMDAANAHTRKELMDLGAAMGTPPWPSPKLGAVVSKHAGLGDPYACRILEHAAEWNFRLVDEAIKALDMTDDSVVPVGIWGSSILKSQHQQASFKALLAKHYPNSEIRIADTDAAQGAVDWAIELVRKGF